MIRFKHEDFFSVAHRSFDIDFSIERSKINLIMGENGIGKTSFMQALKLKSPDLQSYGPIDNNSENILFNEIAFMDQFPIRPISNMSVLELLKIIEEEVEEVKSFKWVGEFFNLDISALLDRKVSYLSGGEQQRFKMCLTLMQQREFYFFDEPFQYLDVKSRELFQAIFKKLLSKHKTLLVIEHNKTYFEDFPLHKISVLDGKVIDGI